jgi:3-phytase
VFNYGITWLASTVLVAATVTAQQPPEQLATIPATWTSVGTAYGTTDSLAVCATGDGRVLVFATAKQADRIDIFDADTGRFVRSHGCTGSAVGQFRYPNGIVAVRLPRAATPGRNTSDDAAILVVERDNARVQAFWADDLSPAGCFGQSELQRPYGGALSTREDGTYLYVTQADVPADRAVCVYRLASAGGAISGTFVRAFGDSSGRGVLHEAESVLVDDRMERVLLCDEDKRQRNVKVYTIDGTFTGQTFGDGLIAGDPEGLALFEDGAGGFVVVTDQRKDITIWHVFDRRTYEHLGDFTGIPPIANTDGICLYPQAFGQFSYGALFAVNNDADIHAYSLANVTRAVAAMRAVQQSERAPEAPDS